MGGRREEWEMLQKQGGMEGDGLAGECSVGIFFLVVFLRDVAVQHLSASLPHMLYLPNLHRFELTEH